MAPQPRAARRGPCSAHRLGTVAGVAPQPQVTRRSSCPANRPIAVVGVAPQPRSAPAGTGSARFAHSSCVPFSEFDEATVPVLDIGGRTAECQHCRVMIWPDEASREHVNLCCAKGRSCSCEALFPIPPPQPLRDLLTFEPTPCARLPPATVSFCKHIRKYNSFLQIASFGINIQSPADGVTMIAIRGAMHHLLGPLAPPQGSPH